jgi:hypothetical protein
MGLLHFEINADGMQQIITDLQATEKQVKFALWRALSRTATTLRTLSARKLKDELQLRTINMLRKRLKQLRLRVSGGDGVTLWFGINDLPVSWFKGTPKQSTEGASFRGQNYKGAFVARFTSKSKGGSAPPGRKTIFRREGKGRLHIIEQGLPISDRAQVIIEDDIFVRTEALIWKNFERELTARVKFNIGEK